MNMNFKKIKILSVGIIFLLAVSPVFAQSAGNSGLSFLKLGFGARNIAMGDAGATVSNDVTSLFYNPAKLSGKDANEIMLMHNEWIEGIRSEVLGVQSKILGLPLAFGFNVTNINDIEVRMRPGDAVSKFNANYFFGSISSGFKIIDNLDAGISVKYLYEGLFTDESTGWGFDFGFYYKTSVEGLTASAVVKNLGSMNVLKNEATKLPTEIRVGPAYSFEIPNSKLGITAAAEFLKYTAADDSHFNLGGEVVYNNIIALRGGYQTGYESKSYTAGVGLMWGNLKFDYALSPFALGLGTGNIFSIQFKF